MGLEEHHGLLKSACGNPQIVNRVGLMLMERPEELTAEARAEERHNANERIVMQERRLGIAPTGEMTRDHPEVQPRIRKTYEPLPAGVTEKDRA